MQRFGDGLAVDPDLTAAAERATEHALAALGGASPDVVAVFVAAPDPDAAEQAVERVRSVTGRAGHLIGCTADGVIGGSLGSEDASAVSVWAASLPGVRVSEFHLEVFVTDDQAAVVGMPPPSPDHAVGFLLGDAFSFPAEAFLRQLGGRWPELPVCGGMAHGALGPGSTRLFLQDDAWRRGAVGFLLGGVDVRPVVSQGCRPIGPDMVVTRADGHAVLELAGMSAFDKLRSVVTELDFPDQALAMAGLQLGVAVDEYADTHERGDFLVRALAGVDPGRGALVLGEALEVGQTVRFQVRDAESASADLRAVLEADVEAHGLASGALLMSCNGRGAALFGDPHHDARIASEVLGSRGLAGFFASGEIGPVAGQNHLHGFTASMLAFRP